MSVIIYCIRCGEYKHGPGTRSSLCNECVDAGFKYCSKCDSILPISEFGGNNKYCRPCNAAYSRDRYQHDEAFRNNKRSINNAWVSKNCLEKSDWHAKELRRKLLRRNAIGTYTIEQWNKSLDYFNHACAYCGTTTDLTIEHIIPVSKGGTHYIYNLIPACSACNYSKNDRDIMVWYPSRPSYTEARLLRIHTWFKNMQKEISYDD